MGTKDKQDDEIIKLRRQVEHLTSQVSEAKQTADYERQQRRLYEARMEGYHEAIKELGAEIRSSRQRQEWEAMFGGPVPPGFAQVFGRR
jgi:hypothetical protein